MASNFFGQRTQAAAATAASLDALMRATPAAGQAAAFTGSAQGTALSFSCDKDCYVGNVSTVTDSSGGAPLAANTPFTDYATGMYGNIVDPTQLYVYGALAGGDLTVTIYFRSV